MTTESAWLQAARACREALTGTPFRAMLYEPGRRMRVFFYDQLLYPQYEPRLLEMTPETLADLQVQAADLLAANRQTAAPHVIAHWESIVQGVAPHGFVVRTP